MLGSSDLLAWLAAMPADQRDRAIEERLGIGDSAPSASPGEHLVGYHPSGVAPIVRALLEAAVTPDDVVVDIGCGLGKVVMLAALLTGARARGVELQPHLVARARVAAAALALPVTFSSEDARVANFDDGTVFFLYVPFSGPVLDRVVDRLACVADKRAIVIATLSVDLPPRRWLTRRDVDSFWLSVYDGRGENVPPRASRVLRSSTDAERIAFERA